MYSLSNLGPQTRQRTRRPLLDLGRGLLGLVALIAYQHAAMAQSGPDAGYKTYRCVVLGDSEACSNPTAQSPVRLEERIELGPMAKYYLHLGMERDDAIARAREGGEDSARRLVHVTSPVLTGRQAYNRLMGKSVDVQSGEEALTSSADPSASCVAADIATGG